MPEVVAAILGALAVIGIPLVAWFSRRATREGRLLLRVERLGSVHALMPASPEKDTFEGYLTAAVADLNTWLNPENAKRRKLIRNINWLTYVVGVIAVILAFPSIDTAANPWQSSVLGVGIGLAIAVVSLGASYLLERNARAESARALEEREQAATALRMDALRHGEPLPGADAVSKK